MASEFVAIRCQRLRTCRKRYCEEFVAIATQSIWRLRRSLVGPGAEISNGTPWDRDCRGIIGGFSARGPGLMGYTGPYSNILRIVAVIRQQIPVQAAFTSRPTDQLENKAPV